MVSFPSGQGHRGIHIEGGKGVGRVTRPGLAVPVGEPAINPVPRRQITESVEEALSMLGLDGSLSVIIDVVNGEKIAEKTLNPRLGILGGISILGTRGTVKPFSNKAYRETITASLDVAGAEGSDTIVLSTGGKSEGLLKRHRPDLPDFTFIQVGDFFSFSLKEAAIRSFNKILYSCFFGKIVKMAQGHPYTHAKESRIDFDLLAEWCRNYGMSETMASKVITANTAREVRGVILASDKSGDIFKGIANKAIASARRFAGGKPLMAYYLFDFNGELLTTLTEKGRWE
jgi:cobalt-precorrin-5B (C1)-methyltransferase